MTADDQPAVPEVRVHVAKVADIDENSGVRVDIGDHRLAVIRAGERVCVIGDRCSHANYSLSEGEVYCDDMAIECWKHGALFSLETGEALTLPATRSVPVYTTEVVDGDVFALLPDPDGELAAAPKDPS